MTQGARIPGTSYELDPVAAAFSIGTMIGWAGTSDAADNLGAILAVGDYLARMAHNEGERPPTVRDLLRSMIQAQAVQACAGEDAPASAVRVACAAAAARLLGGDPAQIAAAVAMARVDETPRAAPASAARFGVLGRGAEPWRCEQPRRASCAARARSRGHAAGDGRAAARAAVAVRTRCAPAGGRPRALEELAASAGAHFGPRQAALICERLAHEDRLLATPINEFAAWLVKNG